MFVARWCAALVCLSGSVLFHQTQVALSAVVASVNSNINKNNRLNSDDDNAEDEYYYLSFDEVIETVDLFSPSHVMTFTVHPREKFCFYEEISEEEIAEAHLQQSSTIDGALFVSGGRNRDVGLEIYDPSADKMYSNTIKKEGSFSIPMTEEGTYEFCFSNQMSVKSDKKVTLALHFEKPKAAPEFLQTEDLLPIGMASDEVYKKLNMVDKELRFLSLRFTLQEVTNKKTLSVSTKFGILESLVVIAVAIVQVLYIRHIVSSSQPLLGGGH